MGCGGSSVVINDNATNPQYINITLKKEIKKLIESNPFYNINETDFTKVIQTYSQTLLTNSISTPLSILLTNISSQFKFVRLHTSIVTDILNFAESKLNMLFDQSNSFYKDLVLVMYSFLNKNCEINKKYQMQFIEKVIKTALISDNEYETGKILIGVLNILQFYLFMFVYCFVSIAVLDLFTNIDYNGIERLFVDKEKWENITPSKLNKIVLDKLQMIDRNLNPQDITEKLLKEVFGSIKQIVLDNENNGIVEMDEDVVNKLIEAICSIGNVVDFEEFFFSGKTKIF